MLSPIHRRLKTAVAILVLVLVSHVQAHGPFDHSARIIVQEDQIELNVILGAEAAGILLRDFPDALLQRGPTGSFPLPSNFGSRVGILRAGDAELQPVSVSVHAEPLESALSLIYRRSSAGRLSFTPRYLELSDRLASGTVEMTDENGNGLGAAGISRNGKPVEFALPQAASNSAVSSGPVAVTNQISTQAPITVLQAPTAPEARRKSMLVPMIAGGAVLLTAIALLLFRARNFRS